MAGPNLHLQLDYALPSELAVGDGTALFVSGWCFCPESRIRSLAVLVNGDPQPLPAALMPRLDSFRALHPALDPYATSELESDPESEADPLMHSYRSGFWGLIEIRSGSGGPGWELELRAELEGGASAVAQLASIAAEPTIDPARVHPPSGAGPLVAIAMATYEPPPDLLARQVESIRAQTHSNWICVISDDCSSEAGQSTLKEVIGDDSRFVVSRSSRRRGFYRNFERALALVPAGATHVAMADQDDVWHPDKLETLLGALGEAQLVYSDARVVSREGEVISGTWWNTRENNHSDLLSLLVANAVTGAASLFRRELLDTALPFPPAQFAHYHDHWVALNALVLGEIAFVERPLYDYVQHGEASLGHEAANQMTSLVARLRRRRSLAERVRMWRLHYFVDVWRLRQFASILLLRSGARISAAKRRTLNNFLNRRSVATRARAARRPRSA